MPSDKRDSIKAKATWLELFTFQCRFSQTRAFFTDLPVSFIPFCSQQKVYLAVACDAWLSFVTEIICMFNSDYFNWRGAFQIVLDS